MFGREHTRKMWSPQPMMVRLPTEVRGAKGGRFWWEVKLGAKTVWRQNGFAVD